MHRAPVVRERARRARARARAYRARVQAGHLFAPVLDRWRAVPKLVSPVSLNWPVHGWDRFWPFLVQMRRTIKDLNGDGRGVTDGSVQLRILTEQRGSVGTSVRMSVRMSVRTGWRPFCTGFGRCRAVSHACSSYTAETACSRLGPVLAVLGPVRGCTAYGTAVRGWLAGWEAGRQVAHPSARWRASFTMVSTSKNSEQFHPSQSWLHSNTRVFAAIIGRLILLA